MSSGNRAWAWARKFCSELPPASAIYRLRGQNPALEKTVWNFKRGLFQAPCFRDKVKFLNILPIRVDSSSLLEMRIIQRIGTFAARMSRRSIVGRDPYSLDLPDPGALKTSEETPLAPWNTISIILCNICAPTALKGLCSFHPASERAVFLSSLFCARYSTPGACRPLLYYRLLYIYRFGRCCNFSALTEPCTSPKQDPLHKPADVASKPEVRRSNPIRSIQRRCGSLDLSARSRQGWIG